MNLIWLSAINVRLLSKVFTSTLISFSVYFIGLKPNFVDQASIKFPQFLRNIVTMCQASNIRCELLLKVSYLFANFADTLFENYTVLCSDCLQ